MTNKKQTKATAEKREIICPKCKRKGTPKIEATRYELEKKAAISIGRCECGLTYIMPRRMTEAEIVAETARRKAEEEKRRAEREAERREVERQEREVSGILKATRKRFGSLGVI